MKKKVICSWSGGKDSCFACYKAMRLGYEVVGLLTMISEEYKRSSSHGIHYELMYKQAEALGLTMVQKKANENNYEEKFKEGIKEFRDKKIRGVVFGDIELDEHKEWVERICKNVNIKAIEPLWGRNSLELFNSFIKEGFKAIIVSVRGDLFDETWIGRKVDKNLLKGLLELEKKGLNVMGENGEFHTFVTEGPIFKKKIKFIKTRPVKKQKYNLQHWFLDIQSYELI